MLLAIRSHRFLPGPNPTSRRIARIAAFLPFTRHAYVFPGLPYILSALPLPLGFKRSLAMMCYQLAYISEHAGGHEVTWASQRALAPPVTTRTPVSSYTQPISAI
jgi:hypothetical protein